MPDPIRIAVLGASGRMGRAIMRLALDDARFRLAGAWVRPGSVADGVQAATLLGRGTCGVRVASDLAAVIRAADVAIDFTRPDTAVEAAGICAAEGRALVSGTTGLSSGDRATLERAADRIPVVWAPNMSVGVNLLLRALDEVARRLGEDYDAEIVEAHHRHKVDAPSGTALALGEVLALARGRELAELMDCGREGQTGERVPGRIGMHSLRGGEIVGEHDVRLIAAGEELRLGHTAFGRDAFAAGALRAAHWLQGREPGLYGMAEVLGF